MNAREYVEKIVAELISRGRRSGAASRGEFLGAALQIIRDVDSPMKEEALVTLATLEFHSSGRKSLQRKKIA